MSQVIFHLKFVLNLILILIFSCALLESLFCCTEPLRKKSDKSEVSSMFLGNNRQHMPVCAKTISSWVRKVSCIAKAHIPLGAVWGSAVSAFGSWCFPGIQPAGG